MKAVILAAGRGSRLGPLSEKRPKCLLPVNGRALLDHHLEALALAGVDDITVVAGYCADQVIGHLAGRCRVIVNDAWHQCNSIVSLHAAAPFVRGAEFVFQNADVLYAPALLPRLARSPHRNSCLVDPLRPWTPGEYHVETAEGRIIRYGRDVPPGRSVGQSAQLVRVCASDSTAFFDEIGRIVARGETSGFPNQAYGILMRGQGLWPVFTGGLPWWEVDTEEDYRNAGRELVELSEAAGDQPPPRLRRLAAFLRRPHVPWRLRWMPRVARAAIHQPLRTLAGVHALSRGQLSVAGLDLQLNGPRFLRTAVHAAELSGMSPFLLWGTLLGAIRDHGFIRNDRDIDLGIVSSDAAGLTSYRHRMQRHGFRVRIENEFKLSMVHPRHPELFVDLDVVHQLGDRWCITNADAVPGRRFHYWFPQRLFARMATRRLGTGLTVRVPAAAEEILETIYGNWKEPEGKLHYLYGPMNVEVEILPVTGPAAGATRVPASPAVRRRA